MKNYFPIACLLAGPLLLCNSKVSAQKLPSAQKASVYAPAKVIIDGKPTEWINKFQAKNDATQFTYVMSNDEQNLYLAIQADNSTAIGLVFYDGISLVVKSKADKKLKPVKITYPLVTKNERTEIVLPLRDKNNNTDSVVTLVNQWLDKSAKKIAVDGIATITDPDVSVYNDVGIQALVQVDATRTMTFEYKLPLKYIKHLIDADGSFDYSIIRNGDTLPPGTIVVRGGRVGDAPSNAPVVDIFAPTDVKATYTLAKKQ